MDIMKCKVCKCEILKNNISIKRNMCKICHKDWRNNYMRNRRSKYSEEQKFEVRLYNASRNYNTTTEIIRDLITTSNGKCQICGRSISIDKLKIDHCHKTLTIRGLLCHYCNIVIGYIEKEGDWIQNFLDNYKKYLYGELSNK